MSKNNSRDLIIYIPDDLEFDKIKINTGAGRISIEKIKTKMREIINEDSPITKIKMTTEEAKAFYEKEQNLRGKLQISSETTVTQSLGASN